MQVFEHLRVNAVYTWGIADAKSVFTTKIDPVGGRMESLNCETVLRYIRFLSTQPTFLEPYKKGKTLKVKCLHTYKMTYCFKRK